jgi:hypothetical protein
MLAVKPRNLIANNKKTRADAVPVACCFSTFLFIAFNSRIQGSAGNFFYRDCFSYRRWSVRVPPQLISAALLRIIIGLFFVSYGFVARWLQLVWLIR